MPTVRIDFSAVGQEQVINAFNTIIRQNDALRDINQRMAQAMQNNNQMAVLALQRQASAVQSVNQQLQTLVASSGGLRRNAQALQQLNNAYNTFAHTMSQGVLSTQTFARAQNQMARVIATTAAQFNTYTGAANTAATAARNFGQAAHAGGGGGSRFNTILQDMGSSAVIVAGPLSGIGSRIVAIGAMAGRSSLAMAGFFAVLSGAIAIIHQAIAEGERYERQMNRINAILGAGITQVRSNAGAIDGLAKSLASVTTFTQDEFREAFASIAQYSQVTNDTLRDVLLRAADLSTITGNSLQETARAIARAMEDPSQYLSELRERGIHLNGAMQQLIETLANSGRRGEASRTLLNELSELLAGTSTGAKQGLASAVQDLSEAWKTLMQTLANSGLLREAAWAIRQLGDAIRWLQGDTAGTIYKATGSFAGITDVRTLETHRDVLLERLENDKRKLADYENLMKRYAEQVWKMPGTTEANAAQRTAALAPGVIASAKTLHDNIQEINKELAMLDKRIKELQGGGLGPVVIRKAGEGVVPDFLSPSARAALTAAQQQAASANILARTGFQQPEQAYFGITNELRETVSQMKIYTQVFDEFGQISLAIPEKLREEFIALNNVIQDTKALERAREMWLDTRRPLEQYIASLTTLEQVHMRVGLSAEVYARQQAKITQNLISQDPLLSRVDSEFSNLGRTITGAFKSAEGAGVSFMSMLERLLDMVAETIIQFAILNPLINSAFGKEVKPTISPAGASSIFETLFGFGGPSADSTAFNQALSLSTNFPVSSWLGGFQHGGEFRVGGSGGHDSQIVAFRASPQEVVRISPNESSSGGGGGGSNIGITLKILDPNGKEVATKGSEGEGGQMSVEAMIDDLVGRMVGQPGSKTNRSLRQNFGLNNSLTRR